MTDSNSILSQVRADGHEQGYQSGRQIHNLEIDEAFQQGVESVKVPSRAPAFFLGCALGMAVMMIMGVAL